VQGFAACRPCKSYGRLREDLPFMQLSDLHWSAVRALSKDTPVLFPIAALEQHGHHLPLFTDSLLLGEVIRRASERLADRVLFGPLLWLGNSEHHLDFAGTLSAPPRAYLDLLGGLLENFIHHGFRRLVLINGHGGNDVPGKQAIFEVRQRHRQRADLLLLFGTYWQLGARPSEIDGGLHQKQMGHACEWETSMMLRLAPHLVGDYKLAGPVDAGSVFEPAARAWITQERSEPGHIGHPALATAEKGEILFRSFADDVVAMLERVIRWDGKSWNR
jgi:creatinine amidohydrolase